MHLCARRWQRHNTTGAQASACDWPGTVLIPSLFHFTIRFAAAKVTRHTLSNGASLQSKLQNQLSYSCALHDIEVKVGAKVIYLNSVQSENKICVDEADARTIEVILKTLTTITTPTTPIRTNKNTHRHVKLRGDYIGVSTRRRLPQGPEMVVLPPVQHLHILCWSHHRLTVESLCFPLLSKGARILSK